MDDVGAAVPNTSTINDSTKIATLAYKSVTLLDT